MASIMINPVKTGEGRIFINPYNYGGASKFNFHNFMKIEGLDRTLGDIEPIYLPDPNRYDEFITNGYIKGSDSRWSSSLSSKLPIDTQSVLETMANTGCEFTLQVHYGRCTKPDSFQDFESAIILKGVKLTSYGLSALTALNPGERALVDETASITASEMYRVFSQKFITMTPQTSGRVLRIAPIDSKDCDNVCGRFKDGSKIWIALVDATENSFAITKDGGSNWEQVATGGIVHADPTWDSLLLVSSGRVYWSSSAVGPSTKIYSADLNEILADDYAPTITEVLTTGLFDPKGIAATDSYIYVVGQDETGFNGEVYRINKTSQTTELIYTNSMGITAVSNLNDDVSLIGTREGELYLSDISGLYYFIGAIGGDDSEIYSLHMFDERRWVASNQNGIYVTDDRGNSWSRTLSMSSINSTSDIFKMSWYDNLVGYVQIGNLIFRSIDAGSSWKKIYTGVSVDEAQSIVVNPNNPNLFFSVANIDSNTSYVVKGYV